MKIAIRTLIIVVLLFSVGCGSNAQSPEEEVQAPKKAEKKEFVVSPQEIVKGQEAKLTWNVIGTGIEKVELIASPAKEVPLKGEKIVSPEETKEYILRITNADGTVETKHVILKVVEDDEDLSQVPSHQEEEVVEPVLKPSTEDVYIPAILGDCKDATKTITTGVESDKSLEVGIVEPKNGKLVGRVTRVVFGASGSLISGGNWNLQTKRYEIAVISALKKAEIYLNGKLMNVLDFSDLCDGKPLNGGSFFLDIDFSDHSDGFYNISVKVWDVDDNIVESESVQVEVNAAKVREKGLKILREQSLISHRWSSLPMNPIIIEVPSNESEKFFLKTKYDAAMWTRYARIIPFEVKRGGEWFMMSFEESIASGGNDWPEPSSPFWKTIDREKIFVHIDPSIPHAGLGSIHGGQDGLRLYIGRPIPLFGVVTIKNDENIENGHIIAHEIGHTLGFEHDNPGSIMDIDGVVYDIITAELVEALHILYFEMKAGDEVPAQ